MAAFTTLALILAGVSAGSQVVGQVKAGNAAKRAGEATAAAAEDAGEIADYNAEVSELQATDALARGDEAVNQYRQQIRQVMGRQVTAFAANGVDVGFGSPTDVAGDARFLGEMDVTQLKVNAAREAWGLKVQAVDFRKRADVARKEGAAAIEVGKQQQSAARWGAATSLLGTGTSLLAARYGKPAASA